MARLRRSDHFLGFDFLVELFGGQEFQGHRRFLQCDVLMMGFFRDLGGVVVPDVRVQGGHQHERVAQMGGDLVASRLDADGAMVVEGHAGISQQAYGLQEVVNHHRLEHVQLKVAR